MSAAGTASGRGEDPLAQVNRLVGRLKLVEAKSSGLTLRRAERLAIFRDIAGWAGARSPDPKDPDAVRNHVITTLIAHMKEPIYADLQPELLRLLVGCDDSSVLIANALRPFLKVEGDDRVLARDYRLRLARNRSEPKYDWLDELFRSPVVEDRFLALQAMGDTGSESTEKSAWALLEDESWQPEGEIVRCATIAQAVTRHEGPGAARLLLLLQKDPRYRASDDAALREATRLWNRRDLLAYVNLAALSDPDPLERERSARFMGAAGIEEARTPLLFLARDRSEPPRVRAAAAAALGGLRIARADLVKKLAAILRDENRVVQRGAVRALGTLAVRDAAVVLVELLGGPLDREARSALAALSGKPADTDWQGWLETGCTLPRGT